MIIGDINNDVINNEIAYVTSMLSCEKRLKKQLLIYMDKLSIAISNMINPTNLDDIHNRLDDIKSNFDKIEISIKSLNSLLELLDKMNENLVEEYNSLLQKIFSDFLEINNSVYTFTSSMEAYICINFPEENVPKTETVVSYIPEEVVSKPPEVTQTNSLKENTLIISDKEKKVILPYKISELEELKTKENATSLDDIINKYFTVSLDLYKNSAVARFREAFNLVKHRERRSFKDAIDLGFELFFYSNLNPAIITACRNLDQLDIYLSCLDDNELDQFKCFDIVYDASPTCVINPQ